jgi:hypothetical protein
MVTLTQQSSVTVTNLQAGRTAWEERRTSKDEDLREFNFKFEFRNRNSSGER